MPSPYSKDLRQKAIAAVKRGERKKDISEMFISVVIPRPVAQTRRISTTAQSIDEIVAEAGCQLWYCLPILPI
jgi:hypothetical protein